MKRLNFFIAALILFASCNNANKGDNEQQNDTAVSEAFVPVDSATAEKNWQEYMTPGAIHKMMASWDGKWNTTITMWMSADATPIEATGSCVNKMVLNGLYQESVHTSTMMGMPFEGHGVLAYDNAKKTFVSSWIDNMGSGIMHMEGAWNEETKTITLTGKGVDPSSGKDCSMKEIYKIVDDNTQTMEMYGPSPVDGKEMKMMEMKLTRSK
ncbi:MAG: DUF1579 domain-containing protein [Chitinophagaceae bacterium]|nr:DUF1579 domain-containing protein [Chitinophagaceae bacterium]MCW5906087.1 DUF1579 domain-containing protein [Chitinophagaceae bacterium]